MTKARKIEQDVVKDDVTDAINRFVGRGQDKIPVPNVSHETGIPERTIHGYKNYQSPLPGLVGMLKLMAALPPDFANQILDISDLRGATPTEASNFCPNRTIAELAEQLGRIAHRNSDNFYDPNETRETGEELQALALDLLCIARGIRNPHR